MTSPAASRGAIEIRAFGLCFGSITRALSRSSGGSPARELAGGSPQRPPGSPAFGHMVLCGIVASN
jgi:hypothetical protein